MRRRWEREKGEGLRMLADKVERGDPKAKSNYMHKARAAGRNYHKDRAGIEDTKAREGREILYTWINLRYVSLGRGGGVPVTRLPLPELDFAYFRPCRSGPCLRPSPAFIHVSLAIDNRGLNFNELRSLCMFARNILCPARSVYAQPVSAKQFAKEFGNGLRHLATLISLPVAIGEQVRKGKLFQNNFMLNSVRTRWNF